MKISIRETVRMGLTYHLNVEPATTIGKLKQLLYEDSSWSEDSAKGMCFTFDGDILDQDEQTLMSYGVGDRSRLEWADLTAVGRDIGTIGMKFVDVSNTNGLTRQAWSTKAPEWRRTRQGLCLEGKCTNPSCRAHNQQVIMPIGFTKFDLIDDVDETTCMCPICKTYVQPTNCGFNNCWWRFSGKKVGEPGKPPVRCVSKKWEHADNAYHIFNEKSTSSISWLKLELEVVKESPPTR